MSARPRFACFAVAACAMAGVAFGQADPERYITKAELQRSGNYALAFADVVGDRLASAASAPRPGLAQNPQPTAGEKASLLAAAIAEDAGWRAAKTIDAVVSLGFKQQRIIDGDWKKVVNARAAPYKGTCHIESTWMDGSRSSGTAFFVGRRVLLTNAHNCWSGDTVGNWASSIEVNPARKGNQRPFGRATCTNFYVPREWTQGKEFHSQYDIAWLILDDRTLYNRVGYHIGYKTSTDAALRGYNLNVNGYPNPYEWKFQQYRDYETKNNIVFAGYFRHFCDSLGGSSGSCCYVILKSGRFCVGVHHAGSTGNVLYNVACRISKRYFDATKDLKAQYP